VILLNISGEYCVCVCSEGIEVIDEHEKEYFMTEQVGRSLLNKKLPIKVNVTVTKNRIVSKW
jgi:hypothetical protein